MLRRLLIKFGYVSKETFPFHTRKARRKNDSIKFCDMKLLNEVEVEVLTWCTSNGEKDGTQVNWVAGRKENKK
jgi:hypothetical protein